MVGRPPIGKTAMTGAERVRKHRLKKHGVIRPQPEFADLLAEQGNACRICGEPFTASLKPHLDHSHNTGATRGVLCFRCNTGLGWFKDEPVWLRQAADYLEPTKPITRPGAAPVTKPITKVTKPDDDRVRVLEAELAGERAEIERLKAELTSSQRRAAAEAKPPSSPPTEAERTIKRLRERNRIANAEIRHLRDWHKKTGIAERGGMSYTTYRRIIKVLHTDVRDPGEAEREDACKAFNVWVDSLKPERD